MIELIEKVRSERDSIGGIGGVVARGVPGHIRSDNGPEFAAHAVREWIAKVGERWSYTFDRFAALYKVYLGFVSGCFLLRSGMGFIGLIRRQYPVGRVGAF